MASRCKCDLEGWHGRFRPFRRAIFKFSSCLFSLVFIGFDGFHVVFMSSCPLEALVFGARAKEPTDGVGGRGLEREPGRAEHPHGHHGEHRPRAPWDL